MILCVTGPMAAGKNAASDILEKEHNFVAVDFDILVHQAIEKAQNKIFESFSELAKSKNIEIKNADGSLNRRQLGALIFTDKLLIKKQEDIVYPIVNEMLKVFLEENKGKNIIFNATVLYKLEAIKLCNKVLFIDAPKIVRLYRAIKRDNMKIKNILARFKAQRTLFTEYKKSTADIYRIWNIGSRANLSKKISHFLDEYL